MYLVLMTIFNERAYWHWSPSIYVIPIVKPCKSPFLEPNQY